MRRFGAEYESYRRAVPAWWPRLCSWRRSRSRPVPLLGDAVGAADVAAWSVPGQVERTTTCGPHDVPPDRESRLSLIVELRHRAGHRVASLPPAAGPPRVLARPPRRAADHRRHPNPAAGRPPARAADTVRITIPGRAERGGHAGALPAVLLPRRHPPATAAPQAPGSIHDGDELGYSLAHAYGAAFHNPDLLVACVIGDGEAETGPLAGAWQANKFLHLVHDATVLPILHRNGYKIANSDLGQAVCVVAASRAHPVTSMIPCAPRSASTMECERNG